MPKTSSIEAAFPLENDSSVYKLDLAGKIYAPSAPELETRIKQAVERGAKCVILDCARLEALDSSALSAIIEGYKNIKSKAAGKVIFCAPSSAIVRVLQLTKMDRFFPIADTLEASIEAAARS